MKTSVPDSAGVRRRGNVILDDRKVSAAELWRIYASSHCFVFPTIGEGFGLTAAEAASTGLPVVYPPATALVDLFEESCGYPVATNPVECDWSWGDSDGFGTPLECRVVCQVCDTVDLARQMLRAFHNPLEACTLGARASEKMSAFTWNGRPTY